MKILLAFACVLSINVASAELVVYEATGIYEDDPLRTFQPGAFRFRAIVDTATAPRAESNYVRYDNPVRDWTISIDGTPIAAMSDSTSAPGSYIIVSDDVMDRAIVPRPHDDFSLGVWTSKVGYSFSWSLRLRDSDLVMLSSSTIPTALDLSLAEPGVVPAVSFSVLARNQFGQVDFFPGHMDLMSFAILSASDLLQRLLTASEGVGPGKSLANKVLLAQTYYAVPDLVSTCLVLAEYVQHTAHKKVPAAQGVALADDAHLIMSAIACVQ